MRRWLTALPEFLVIVWFSDDRIADVFVRKGK